MKKLELKLKEHIIIIEIPEGAEYKITSKIFALTLPSGNIELLKKKLELICKGDELNEDILEPIIETKAYGSEPYFCTLDYTRKGKNKDGFNPGFCAPNGNQFITSFISVVESIGFHWRKNPIEKPTMEKYGWYSANSQEEESGWMYEEGEQKYYEALKEYEIENQENFDPENCIICRVLE